MMSEFDEDNIMLFLVTTVIEAKEKDENPNENTKVSENFKRRIEEKNVKILKRIISNNGGK